MEQSTLSAPLVRKFSALFARCDRNGDGVLSEEDFRAQAQHIQQIFGWADDDRRTKRLFADRGELFHRLVSGADKDRSGTVSLPEFLRYFERQIVVFRAAGAASPWLLSSCRDLIDLIDRDNSGSICAEEFAKLLSAQGSSADAATLFGKLDRNGDGRLTLDELLALSFEFMTSDDPQAPGNQFFCGDF